MVQRYDEAISYGGAFSDVAFMEPRDNGGYVKFEDYAAVSALCEKTRTALDAAVAFISNHAGDPDLTETMIENYGRYVDAMRCLGLSHNGDVLERTVVDDE